MKLTIARRPLWTAIGRVVGIIPNNTPKPILKNLLLTAGDNELTVEATDLEVGVRVLLTGARVSESGRVLISATKLNEILTKASDTEVDIETDDDKVVISGERFKFKLPSDDPDGFPSIPAFEADDYLVLDGPKFKEAIKRTIYSTDVESTRYALGGVCLDLNSDPCFVGTDGRRLARQFAVTSVEGSEVSTRTALVIPCKALKLIDKNLSDVPVHFSTDGKSALLRMGDSTIYTRLVEGRFPRYIDVFPAGESVAVVTLPVADLLRGVEQASILTTDDSRGVDFELSTNKLTLSTNVTDSGAANIVVVCDYDGPTVPITFDPRYLADALKSLPGDGSVTLRLIDHKSAAILQTGDGFDYVVMPLTRDR